MNATARGGIKHGTAHVEWLTDCGVNVRTGLILDVGCGWGRLAYGLLTTGFAGQYIGVDIVKERIDWLNANFTPVHPRYTFQFSDVRNDLYNPKGTLLRIPFDTIAGNAAPDTIVLLSVFTHMYERDVADYLSNISAIMAAKSRLVFTCFLFDGVAQEGIKRGTARRRFKYKLTADCRYDIWRRPLEAIAYTEALMLRLIGQAGLTGRVIRGSWSDAALSPQWAQDVIIANKIPSGPERTNRLSEHQE
jgi:SAM-dependent methyltransferase